MRGFPLNEIQEPARALENHGPTLRGLDTASVSALDYDQGVSLEAFIPAIAIAYIRMDSLMRPLAICADSVPVRQARNLDKLSLAVYHVR